MPLTNDDLRRLARGEHVELPPQLFISPEPREWPDDPNLRRAVDWLKGYVGDDWQARRLAAFARLHSSALGDMGDEEKGYFYDRGDVFGWYLFVAEAALDHLWNFEPMFGARVIPLLRAIGRSMPLLIGVPGLDERMRRMVGTERAQPNGTLFELLVAAAYRRGGADVAFVPEAPGQKKTHDLDVTLNGVTYAVECKRLETSEYGDKERMRMRTLWHPASEWIASLERSAFCSVDFKVETAGVPDDYLLGKVTEWLSSGRPSMLWDDDVGRGVIGDMDLGPLQEALSGGNDILAAGTLTIKLLTGRYHRHESHIQAIKYRSDSSPRLMNECTQAIVLRWKCSAGASVNAKAKDVVAKLARATEQLPSDRPGIVHIGLEAVEGDASEQARIERVLSSLERFDPKGKPLEFAYVHYFIPDSPPEGGWDFEERVDWRRISGGRQPPLLPAMLVTPSNEN